MTQPKVHVSGGVNGWIEPPPEVNETTLFDYCKPQHRQNLERGDEDARKTIRAAMGSYLGQLKTVRGSLNVVITETEQREKIAKISSLSRKLHRRLVSSQLRRKTEKSEQYMTEIKAISEESYQSLSRLDLNTRVLVMKHMLAERYSIEDFLDVLSDCRFGLMANSLLTMASHLGTMSFSHKNSRFPRFTDPHLALLVRTLLPVWKRCTGRVTSMTTTDRSNGKYPFGQWVIGLLKLCDVSSLPSFEQVNGIAKKLKPTKSSKVKTAPTYHPP